MRPRNFFDTAQNVVGGCRPRSKACRLFCYVPGLVAGRQTVAQDPLYLGTTRWRDGRPHFNHHTTVLPQRHRNWTKPVWWNPKDPVMGPGQPGLILIGSMSDLFFEKHADTSIEKVLAGYLETRHVGLLLTRHPERMAAHLSRPRSQAELGRLKAHVWPGFSAADQPEFDRHWPHIRPLAEAGWTTFVSIAPMMERVVLPDDFLRLAKWTICRGEQNGKWPMPPAWARSLRDQCREAGVPFFLKGLSGRRPIPEDLRIWQFPRAAPLEPTP